MKTSGLSSELDPDARYTAFVPSDQAFSALPAETLKELFNNKKILRETLRLHLASGKIVTETMTDNRKITTLDGSQELRINVADDGKVIQLYMYSIVSECRSSRVAFLGAWFSFPILSPFCSFPRFLVTPFSLFPKIFSPLAFSCPFVSSHFLGHWFTCSLVSSILRFLVISSSCSFPFNRSCVFVLTFPGYPPPPPTLFLPPVSSLHLIVFSLSVILFSWFPHRSPFR